MVLSLNSPGGAYLWNAQVVAGFVYLHTYNGLFIYLHTPYLFASLIYERRCALSAFLSSLQMLVNWCVCSKLLCILSSRLTAAQAVWRRWGLAGPSASFTNSENAEVLHICIHKNSKAQWNGATLALCVFILWTLKIMLIANGHIYGFIIITTEPVRTSRRIKCLPTGSERLGRK